MYFPILLFKRCWHFLLFLCQTIDFDANCQWVFAQPTNFVHLIGKEDPKFISTKWMLSQNSKFGRIILWLNLYVFRIDFRSKRNRKITMRKWIAWVQCSLSTMVLIFRLHVFSSSPCFRSRSTQCYWTISSNNNKNTTTNNKWNAFLTWKLFISAQNFMLPPFNDVSSHRELPRFRLFVILIPILVFNVSLFSISTGFTLPNFGFRWFEWCWGGQFGCAYGYFCTFKGDCIFHSAPTISFLHSISWEEKKTHTKNVWN